jgi:hypothetical protein
MWRRIVEWIFGRPSDESIRKHAPAFSLDLRPDPTDRIIEQLAETFEKLEEEVHRHVAARPPEAHT